jgi:peptidoglycan/xylan/chitin deacetylase (PgdA/CDA1 family)
VNGVIIRDILQGRVRTKLSINLLFTISAVLLVAGCALMGEKPKERIPTGPPTSKMYPRIATLVAGPGDSLRSIAFQYLADPSMDWLLAEVNGTKSITAGQPLVVPLDPLEIGGSTVNGYQTVPVLTYHKFTKGRGDATTVTEKAFEEQMRFLKTNGYHVITMDQFFEFIEFKRQIPSKSVVITIDDGWRSFYEIGFPILKKYGYPATLFVYTDFIFGNSKSLMDWNALREMVKNDIDIQSHTKTHRYLDRRTGTESYRDYFEAVKKELIESAAIIKKNLDIDVQYLAYPYGETNHLVVALLEKLRYRGAFTVERASAPAFANRFRINRSMVYGTYDLKDFANNLKAFSDQALKHQ